MNDTTSGAYALRVTDFGDFLQRWRTLTGNSFPMPTFSAASVADFRGRFRATRVRDVAITESAHASCRCCGGAR